MGLKGSLLIGSLYLSDIWKSFVVKNGHLKDVCCHEIGLYAQNIDTILDSIMNTIGRAYVIILRIRDSSLWTLIMIASLFEF